SIIELANNELGLKVVERSIDRTEVYVADEMFMTGTAAQVVAVTRIDHRPLGAGLMGPITTQLRSLFDDVVRAKVPKYQNWAMEVK
ncbi:MAG: branched chain amino acid aminotransferase, partial [Anaerolineaceae bacterium]